jgi:hypothetical protein
MLVIHPVFTITGAKWIPLQYKQYFDAFTDPPAATALSNEV